MDIGLNRPNIQPFLPTVNALRHYFFSIHHYFPLILTLSLVYLSLSLITRHFFYYFCPMPDHLTYPYRYHAYGLDILSQLPVTGFEPAEVSNADVTIRLGEVPESLPDAINKGVLYQSTQN